MLSVVLSYALYLLTETYEINQSITFRFRVNKKNFLCWGLSSVNNVVWQPVSAPSSNYCTAAQNERFLLLFGVLPSFTKFYLANFMHINFLTCERRSAHGNCHPFLTTGTSSVIKWPKPTGGRTTSSSSSYWIIRQYQTQDCLAVAILWVMSKHSVESRDEVPLKLIMLMTSWNLMHKFVKQV